MESLFSPNILLRPQTLVVGVKIRTCLAENRTGELWRTFMPSLKSTTNRRSDELLSIEIFDHAGMVTPQTLFEKWAAVEVSSISIVPEGMHSMCIPEGLYAQFTYTGDGSDAGKFFQTIHEEWFPGSGFILDSRPQLAIMGAAYKRNDPQSQEQILIPVKRLIG